MTIPNSVTSIGFEAFSNCRGLTSITIGSSVTSIDGLAFNGCSRLKSVNIPNSVTRIVNSAFAECDSITELIWNASNCDSYGDMPMNNIKRLTIGEEVNMLYNLFSGTSGLTDLTWNARNCNSNGNMQTINIEHVTIGENVEVLPQNFAKDSKIESLFIPKSVTSIGNNAFYNCSELDDVVVESDNNVYDSRGNCNAIIETATNTLIAGSNNAAVPVTVTSIGNNAFSGRSGLTSIVIPNSVAVIGESAFFGCRGLADIDISNSVTTINNNTFQGCTSLTDVAIPNSVTSIGEYAFQGCTSLTNATIPNTVTSIGKSAFQGCSSLTDVTIPNSIAIIRESTFRGCTSLTDVTIPNSVTTIVGLAFYDCSSLTSVTIGRSVNKIDYRIGAVSYASFGNCNNIKTLIWNAINCPDNNRIPKTNIEQVLIGDEVAVLPESFVSGSKITTVNIPNSVTSIGANAFSGCANLASVNLGNSVESIGNSAFSGCSNLSDKLTIPNSVSSIGSNAFQNCSQLTSVTLGSSVANIGNSAFSGCSGLTSVTIPNSVTSIGSQAFSSCSNMTNVVIGKSTETIGDGAFLRSPRIAKVTSLNKVPPTCNANLFSDNVYIHAVLYVPDVSVSEYISTDGWGPFIHVEGLETSDIVLANCITLDRQNMIIGVGTTSRLIATVLPDSTTNKAVTWATSNPAVASVDGTGMVSAVAPGSAIITAMTTDGSNLSASCTVETFNDLSQYSDYLLLNDAEVFHGDTIVIPVMMTNANSITAFQTDIVLPEGLELLKEDDEYIIDPSERMTRTHSIMSSDVASGAIRVLCYSSNYKPFTGESGDELFYITLKVADDAEGDYRIELKNTLLTNTDFVDLPAPDVAATINVKAYLLGDANNNGTVTVGDVVATAQYVLEQNPQPFNYEAADVNEDNNITVADVARIAWMVLNPTAYAPMRAPALWSNGDRMSGESISLMPSETRRVSIMLDNEMDYSAFQLDLNLPEGLMASNFNLTDRAGSHAFDVNTLKSGSVRALCYSPALTAIGGHEGALLTFDVTATGTVFGDITVDGIEIVTTDCQSVWLDGFAIGVNNSTAVNELANGKTVARVDYFNLAGQQVDCPESGVTLVVTTYTDGTRTTNKVFK